MAHKKNKAIFMPKTARSLMYGTAKDLVYKLACQPLSFQTGRVALFIAGNALGLLDAKGRFTYKYFYNGPVVKAGVNESGRHSSR